MIEASLVYIVAVYAVYCVWFVMKKPAKRTHRVYTVRTTFCAKTHTAQSWDDALDWAHAYRKVECAVFIDGHQVR